MTRSLWALVCAGLFLVLLLCAGSPALANRYLAFTPQALWEWEFAGIPVISCQPCPGTQVRMADVQPTTTISAEHFVAAAYDLDRGLLYSSEEMGDNPDLSPSLLLLPDTGPPLSLQEILDADDWVVFESATGSVTQGRMGRESAIVIEGNGTSGSFSFGCTMSTVGGGDWGLALLAIAAGEAVRRRSLRVRRSR